MKTDEMELIPSQIVKELEKYVVGQREAKKAVSIALRNRWRRKQLPKHIRDEIYPKNILMMGPTGVGKTEIARRLAKLSHAPFLKVEATKYTEVGYVGKDVESMIRDLTEIAVNMVKAKEQEIFSPKAKELAEERLLDLLVPYSASFSDKDAITPLHIENNSREKARQMLRNGELNEREVQFETKDKPVAGFEVFAMPGLEEMGNNIRDFVGQMVPKKSRKRKVKVPEALKILEHEEIQKLIDMDKVIPQALELVSQNGIVFLDEIDKIVENSEGFKGGHVSREGVQRDLLPIVEGSAVNTKYGVVHTDHILFIAAGAFHQSKPSDLIPELQGRFPIRVELKALTTQDFSRILTEPENSLLKQYVSLMETEKVNLIFKEEAVSAISQLASEVNERTENIGARRLHTILEKVLEELSFSAPEISGQTIEVTEDYVLSRVGELAKNLDLSRYIL